MRKFYLLLCFLVCYYCDFAQVSVTATIGTIGPTAYTTLQATFDAINLGMHRGIITITITGNTTETNTAVINASGSGTASYTAVIIRPAAPVVVSGNISGPLINLNGADNVTINGLNNGDAALTFSNANTGTSASTIQFINDATADTIRNTTILGASTSTTSGTVFFGAGTTTGNDNNLIANCNIADAASGFPVNAVYSGGLAVAGQENNNNTISSNNISNFFNADLSTAGVLVAAGSTDWTISGNRFFQTVARVFTTGLPHRVIQITSGNNYSITNNIIGYATATGTGTYILGGAVITRFLAIDLAVGTATASNVQNNTITAFSFATSSTASSASGIWSGINIAAGNVNVGTTTGNTIGSTTGTGAIVINPTVAGTLTVGITSASLGSVTISNNSIGAIDVLPSGVLSGNLLGIQTQGASGTVAITNNTVGTTSDNSMRVGVPGTTTGNGIIRGVLNSNSGTITISGNTIRNLTHNSSNALALFRAIECQQGTAIITGNSISNITAYGTATSALTPEGAGILVTASGAVQIDQNTISGLNVTNTPATGGPVVMGIYLGSAVNGASITRNKIYGFTNTSNAASTTTPPIIAGVYCRDAATTNPNILIANNMISFGFAQISNTAIIGIWNAAASANGLTTRVYYNTVNIEGSLVSGAQPSFCYLRGDFTATAFATPTIDINNNIFTNSRSGNGGGKHYAIANGYNVTSSAGGWTANYNFIQANAATVGYWSGDKTFAGWQTASAGDANSLSGTNLIYANASIGDLHLTSNVDTVVNGKATPLTAITNDFDNQLRNATMPDMGADEFDPGALPITIEYFTGRKQGSEHLLTWKADCSTPTVTFDIERSGDGRSFSRIMTTTATQARCALPFTLSDQAPLPGINYYRLKMIEADGSVTYSPIIAVMNSRQGFAIIGLFPTIVNSKATLRFTSAENNRLSIVISDLLGKPVYRQTATVTSGSGNLQLNVINLATGTYQITCVPDKGATKTMRFLKQ